MIKLTLIQGDCLKVLPKLPSESVDLVVTDPPYGISKIATIRRERNPLKYKYIGKDINFNFGEWDLFETKEEFLEFTKKWFFECCRILKPNAHIVSFFDKWKINYLVEWGEKFGVSGRQPLFWIKQNPVPPARRVAFMNCVEMMYWGTKFTEKKTNAIFNYELGIHPEYIITPICQGKERTKHPTQKPKKVIEWLLKYLTKENMIVLDPFVGSGTTMKACLELKRNCIGVEISSEYISITKNRLNWGYSLGDVQFEFYTEDGFKGVFKDVKND